MNCYKHLIKKLFKINEPYSATWEEWKTIEKNQKQNQPLAYFFYRALPLFFAKIENRISYFYWWFKHRLHPKHQYHIVRTNLKPDYYEIDTRMLYACFSLLTEYVENVLVKSVIVNIDNFDFLSTTEKGIKALNEMIKFHEEESNLEDFESQKELMISHKKLYEETKELYSWWKIKYLPSENSYDYEQEQKRIEEEQEMLIRLIKIRGFLWY